VLAGSRAFFGVQLWLTPVTDNDSETKSEQDASPSVAPAAEIRAPAVVPHGVRQSLDPRYVPFQRTVGWIVTACVSLATFAIAVGLLIGGEAPRWFNLLLLPAWLAVSVAVAWLSYTWPTLEYRHTSYLLDEHGIEIHAGVFWRVVMSVPRSRVQHNDVSQGPIERAYGLGRLVIFTAGTEHSRVELPGLPHEFAFALRNYLLPRGDDDAV
jgi:membrane protein YdbS with pleckstrin-like domain